MPKYQRIDLHAIARQTMERYEFEARPSKFVLREVEALKESAVIRPARRDAEDLRGLLWSSIDNIDSLDLDQLEYCERLGGQEIAVKVAIADVDAFVPKGCKADDYAAGNGTSVYTGIENFPMLPLRLSTDLTSLRVGQDRLAIVAEFTVLKDGSLRTGRVYRAIVHNKAKLVYEELGDWLEGKGPMPQAVREMPELETQVRLQDEAAQSLRRFRLEQGALELETIEAKPIVEKEAVISLVVPRENKARYIIENLMIAANRTMADFLEKARFPFIERVVRVPKDWERIREVAAECGEALPWAPDPKALSEFLLKRKEVDPEHFPDLSLTVVKLLGAGEYVALFPGEASYGHFGLAIIDYTHSTAPNRRYVDLVIQRLVKAALGKRPYPYSAKELRHISFWCTDRDMASKKVERFMRKAEAAALLSGRVQERFEAIVTGASEKGTYVRLIDPPVEGRVVRNERGMFVGQKVRVRLIGVNPYKGHVDLVGLGRQS